MNLNRREAIIRMATAMGATIVGPRLLAATLDAPRGPHGYTKDQIALMDEIGETIIPATDIPGAKAVNIGAFMAMMVDDCYEPRDQAVFEEGLRNVDRTFRRRFGRPFVEGSSADRTTLLNELDREQKDYTARKQPEDLPHFFRMMKELTILGYFSSEVGATQAVRFIEVPGRYDGCAPYQKGDRAWFS